MTKINTNKQKIQELLERGTIVEILPKKEDFAKKLLSGEKSPYLDLVAMNTSAALYVMGYSKEINTAINDVYDIISSGKVLNKLKKIVKYTND